MALPFLAPCRQEAVAQAAANGSATNGNNKRQLEGDEPSAGIKRQKSGSGTEALTKDGSAPLSAEEVRHSAVCHWCAWGPVQPCHGQQRCMHIMCAST